MILTLLVTLIVMLSERVRSRGSEKRGQAGLTIKRQMRWSLLGRESINTMSVGTSSRKDPIGHILTYPHNMSLQDTVRLPSAGQTQEKKKVNYSGRSDLPRSH